VHRAGALGRLRRPPEQAICLNFAHRHPRDLTASTWYRQRKLIRILNSKPQYGNHVRKLLWTILDESEEIITWITWDRPGCEEEEHWVKSAQEELGPCGANYEKVCDVTYFIEDDRIFANTL